MIWNEKENSWRLETCKIREWENNNFIFYTLKDTTLFIQDVNPEIIKKDFVKPEEMDYRELSTFIKKLDNKGLNNLKRQISTIIKTNYITETLLIPYDKSSHINLFYTLTNVISKKNRYDGTEITIEGEKGTIKNLIKKLE